MSRDTPEQEVARARRLADNMDFKETFDRARNQCIADLESCVLDGSVAKDEIALGHVRKLHALLAIKMEMVRPIRNRMLKEQNAE